MVICRLILGIFGDVQNFQFSRFQKIWKFSRNCCFWQITKYWVFPHSVLVTEFDFSLGIFEFSTSWNFQIPDSRKSGNGHFWQIATYWLFFPLSLVHWVWFFTRNFQIFIFLEFPGSRKSGNFLESGTWKFQENENLKILSEKSNSVNKTKWEKYPICCNLSKMAIFRFSGVWNSGNFT